MKYSMIIPCFNEADNIKNVIAKVRPLQDQYNMEVIFVENGSGDGSRRYFQDYVEGRFLHVKVIYVDENLGYGYGLQCGIKAATGDYIGWIHADLQMAPGELIQFFDEVNRHSLGERLFLKGLRKNRSIFDRFFTNGQSIFNTCLFGMKLFDIGAVPVLFSRSLLECFDISQLPNDFSIELYIYKQAVENGYKIIRCKVEILAREKGASSWNHGLKSKLKQSQRIFNDSMKIKRGEKVL